LIFFNETYICRWPKKLAPSYFSEGHAGPGCRRKILGWSFGDPYCHLTGPANIIVQEQAPENCCFSMHEFQQCPVTDVAASCGKVLGSQIVIGAEIIYLKSISYGGSLQSTGNHPVIP
jgi:hypothetical protein